MSTMETAFKKAGYDGASTRLAMKAWARLKEVGGDAKKALPKFLNDLTDDKLFEALALSYLYDRARDLNGKQRDGGQGAYDAQLVDAPAPLPAMPGGGQRSCEAHSNYASSPAPSGEGKANHTLMPRQEVPSSSPPSRDGDKGQLPADAHGLAAPPSRPHRAGAGQNRGDAQAMPARPVREPSKTDRKAMVATRNKTALSIFDRHLGMGDIVVGDATKVTFVNLRKKGLIVTATADRFLTDIDWPDDDKTPLRKCATEKQVKSIFDAGYKSLDLLGVTNVRA